MGQIMATPQSGDRLIVGTFMAGQIVMLDTSDRFNLKQLSVVNFGANAGPHNIVLSDDDRRLVVTDYFLNEDEAGIIHYEGDHKVHVLNVTHNKLSEDKRFNLDFNTAFKTGPARPHGIAMK
jgi:selenium-binding protein 1